MLDHQSQCQSQKKILLILKNNLNYGADAVRLFILSDSPPEKDVQWSEQGMVASYKFLQKLWNLHKNKNKIKVDEKIESKK